MPITALKAHEPAVEIRPGVFCPDGSAVSTPAAREALSGRMTARAGLLEKWSHPLEESEDVVWRTVLQLYANRGRPPRPGEVAAETGVAAGRVAAPLGKLQLRDLVGFEPSSGQIQYAYPFTEATTGHAVELRGNRLHALCAIDALGVAGMYGADVKVHS
jgi:alkylmercury lyase